MPSMVGGATVALTEDLPAMDAGHIQPAGRYRETLFQRANALPAIHSINLTTYALLMFAVILLCLS